MDQTAPTAFPLLPQRLPPPARAALAGCGVAALALALCGTLTSGNGHGTTGERWGGLVVPMAVALASPVAWARHRPWPVLAVLLAEMTVAAAALGSGLEQLWPLLLVAGLLVALITAARAPRAGVAAAALTLTVQQIAWQASLFDEGGWRRVLAPGFLGLTVLLALSVLAAWLAGTLIRQRREYEQALHGHATAEAVTAERLRIARDLHDMIAHSIGVIAIQAGAGSRVIDTAPEQTRDALEAIEDTSRRTLSELRRMLGILRQAEPDPATPAGTEPLAGLAALDRLAASTADAGVQMQVRRRGTPAPLPPTIDHAAFRIVQESVTNVVRHAGTPRCQVTIEHRPGELLVQITDDGPGSASATGPGYGISGMRERVALLNGHLTAGPRPDGGFAVSARLPIPATAPGPSRPPQSIRAR
ncbi:sensor histidine kinase [Actinomadura coerulea]|uniref:sensor histidine kinase n=1 Tax=Actinomadura coerulea TaxID=46159 RepID=UPI003441F731